MPICVSLYYDIYFSFQLFLFIFEKILFQVYHNLFHTYSIIYSSLSKMCKIIFSHTPLYTNNIHFVFIFFAFVSFSHFHQWMINRHIKYSFVIPFLWTSFLKPFKYIIYVVHCTFYMIIWCGTLFSKFFVLQMFVWMQWKSFSYILIKYLYIRHTHTSKKWKVSMAVTVVTDRENEAI